MQKGRGGIEIPPRPLSFTRHARRAAELFVCAAYFTVTLTVGDVELATVVLPA